MAFAPMSAARFLANTTALFDFAQVALDHHFALGLAGDGGHQFVVGHVVCRTWRTCAPASVRVTTCVAKRNAEHYGSGLGDLLGVYFHIEPLGLPRLSAVLVRGDTGTLRFNVPFVQLQNAATNVQTQYVACAFQPNANRVLYDTGWLPDDPRPVRCRLQLYRGIDHFSDGFGCEDFAGHASLTMFSP